MTHRVRRFRLAVLCAGFFGGMLSGCATTRDAAANPGKPPLAVYPIAGSGLQDSHAVAAAEALPAKPSTPGEYVGGALLGLLVGGLESLARSGFTWSP